MRSIPRLGLLLAGGVAVIAAVIAILLPVGGALIAAMDRDSDPAPKLAPTRVASAPRQHRAAVRPPAPRPAPASVARADEALASLHIVRELRIPHWLQPGQFVWNDDNVPPGERIIVVNIRARVLSVYRGGIEIGRSSLIYGADNKPTPTGTFPILEKDADHWSNLYDAPMPHMLRLTMDGVALHGSRGLANDAATHGCIGLPPEFAGLLYDAVKVGDRVIVVSGENAA